MTANLRATPILLLAVLFLAVGSPRAAMAAEVSIEVSTRAVSVGEPFSLSVVIDKADDHEPPRLPALEGLIVVGGPSTRSSTSFANGRLVEDSVTTSWQLLARRPGRYTIPAIKVVADGEEFQSNPIVVNVVEAPPAAADAADEELFFARVEPERETVYLGEPLRATLHVWIRPFRHPQLNGSLDDEDMWSCVETGRSTWGDFAPVIEGLKTPFGSRPLPGRREVRKRGDAEEVYYRYDLDAQLWPRQAGALSLEPIELWMQYPKSLARRRGFFNSGLTVTASKHLGIVAAMPAVQVLAPPEAGRPPTFNGAVGRFGFNVTARPTQVAVGDPITLTLTIDDRTPGGTLLDLVAAPPLDRVAEIDRDFKVPTDPLSGIVKDRRKTFTQTVRAKNDAVTAIPAIPFAYFDPEAAAYVTVASDPIPLEVRPSSTLAMSDVVGGAGPAEPRATELTEVAGGLLANASGPELLRAERGFELRWLHAFVLALPCLLFAGVAIGQRQVRRLRHDDGYARRRGAKRKALRRIGDARRSEGNHQAERIAAAVSDYVADRCNAPPGTLTRTEVAERLGASGVGPELGAEVETLLAECEQLRFAGGADAARDSIPERATRCIERLERERLR